MNMIGKIFHPNPQNKPLRKFRGKKKYFKNILKNASNLSLYLEPDTWFDHWHYHADWNGIGNYCWNYRKQHIQALCIVFQSIANNIQTYNRPYQLYIYLNRNDSSQDAVFLHTENPNNSEFPASFTELNWGVPVIESYFEGHLTPYSFKAGTMKWYDSDIYIIYSPELGLPLYENKKTENSITI